jgi:hypothetical protein
VTDELGDTPVSPVSADPSVDVPAFDEVTPHHGVRTFGPLTYVALVVGGLFLGVLGVVLVAVRAPVRGTYVPWGLVLMVVALPVCVRAAAWFVGSRTGALAVALAWVAPTLLFATTNPGGDVLLPDLQRTYVYLVGGSVLTLLACVWPLPSGSRAFVRGGPPPAWIEPAAPVPAESDAPDGLQG